MGLNYIPVQNESIKGVLQDMLNKNLERKIFLDSSPTVSNRSDIFYDNSAYFCSLNTEDVSQNFLIVGLKDRILYPTGYVIKSYPDTINNLRGWDLFGSLDNSIWTKIHFVPDSADLENGKIGRYELSGGPFHYFKIVQTARCLRNDEDFRYKLRIVYLDFFGFIWNGLCTKNKCTNHSNIPYFIVLIYS